MAATPIPVPKPGEGEPIVFFDITLGGKYLHLPFHQDHINETGAFCPAKRKSIEI